MCCTFFNIKQKLWEYVSPSLTALDIGLFHIHFRIHFAGTESATVWCGFMNGAVQAGNRAALEILYDLRPQLVSVQDIAGIKHPRKKLVKKETSGKKVMKWTFRIGAVTLLMFTIKKVYQQVSG